MANFQGARAKLTIGSLDDAKLSVEAQYNPKELEVEKPVSWSEKPEAQLEFIGIQSRTFKVELFFDCYEGGEIATAIDRLDKLSSPRDYGSTIEAMRRPHMCVVLWGEGGLPRMRCVIENVSTKYVMWNENGKPLRAICTVSLKEMRLDATELAKQGDAQMRSAANRATARANAQARNTALR